MCRPEARNRGKLDTSNTRIHEHSLSSLDTGTIQSGEVELVLCTVNLRVSPFTCRLEVSLRRHEKLHNHSYIYNASMCYELSVSIFICRSEVSIPILENQTTIKNGLILIYIVSTAK